MPRYEFSDGSSNKFWEITLQGNGFVASWGKIGTAGQSKPQTFESAEKAKKEYEKLIAEKTKKGYQLVSSGSPPASAKPSAPAAAAKKPAPAPTPKNDDDDGDEDSEAPAARGKGRRFEFVEDGSSKFWEIELEGETFTARWGKIGTSGQSKTQEFDSPKEARAAAEKLINEKLKKGYEEVGGGDDAEGDGDGGGDFQWNADCEAAILKNPEDPKAYLVYADWLQSHDNPVGELIALQHAKKENSDQAKAIIEENFEAWFGEAAAEAHEAEDLDLTWRWGFIDSVWCGHQGYDSSSDAPEVLNRVLSSPLARFVRSVTLGLTDYEDGEPQAQNLVDVLVKRAPQALQRLEVADFEYPDDTEMSWAHPGDMKSVWKAMPGLREVVFRGGNLEVGKIDAPELKSFTIETGGLSKENVENILGAKWPKLETLKIWLGQENYGFESSLDDFKPLFDAKGLGSVKHLGIMNSEFADELIPALAKSKILKQLETLDLSLGTLTTDGAKALKEHLGAFKHLQSLNLKENLLDEEGIALVKTLGLNIIDAEDQRDFDPEYRYSAVGE